MSTSRSSLLRALAQDMFPDRYVEFSALAAAESTATVVAGAELRHGTASNQSLAHGWYYIYAGAAAGDERQIVAYSPTANSTYGTISLARPASSTPDASSDGLAYNGGLAPSQLLRHINRALRTSRHQQTRGHTLVVDGRMEESDADSWGDVDATITKVAGGNATTEGARSLSVLATSAGGYAVNDTQLFVAPGTELHVEATVRVTNTSGTHSASLVLWDTTNGAAFLTLTTDSRAPIRLKGIGTVPAGCLGVEVRLVGVTNGCTAGWDEVLVWAPSQPRLRLLSDLDSAEDVYAVWERVSSDGSSPWASSSRRIAGWKVAIDPSAATPFVLDLSSSDWSGGNPVFVEAMLPWAELSADTDTTNADQDDVLLRARAYAYAQLAKIGPRDERSFYRQTADELAATWATRASRQPRPARPITGPTTVRGSRGQSSRRWWRG